MSEDTPTDYDKNWQPIQMSAQEAREVFKPEPLKTTTTPVTTDSATARVELNEITGDMRATSGELLLRRFCLAPTTQIKLTGSIESNDSKVDVTLELTYEEVRELYTQLEAALVLSEESK